MNFDFIKDEKFRHVLERDYQELLICSNNKANKSVLLLSGSIVEALLLEYFTTFPVNNIPRETILKKNLYELIDLAETEKLISGSTKDLSTVIRNYRNLIHPGREIRKNQSFDEDTAQVAKSLLNIIAKEIRENYLNQIGYSSAEIINKLENDSVSLPIFVKLLNKLHKIERNKLYGKLVEYDSVNTDILDNKINQPKQYLGKLKPFIGLETKTSMLKKLVKIVETGEQAEIMNYYNMLHEDLHLLSVEDQEFVLLYVINVFSLTLKEESKLRLYMSQQLFSSLGNHLQSKEVKLEFFKLMAKFVQNFNEKISYAMFTAYDQYFITLSEDLKQETYNYIKENTYDYYMDQFYTAHEEYSNLPF